MRTFELSETSRFWAIERLGTTVTIRFGKLGGKAATRSTTADSLGESMQSYQRQIRNKLRDGYEETTEDAPPLEATGLALESALVENPDDLAAHMAFADWLSEQHDEHLQARGEFVRLQLQLEDEALAAGQRKKIAKREKELLAAHEARWLGWRLADVLYHGGADPASNWVSTVGYRRGWADRLTVPMVNTALARSIGEAPALRLLRELVIENGDYSEDALLALADFEHLGNLRKLRIDDVAHSDHLDAFVARLPHLEELHIQALEQNLGGLFALGSLGNLRKLHVAEAREFDVKALAKNKSLRRLTHLFLFPDLAPSSSGPPIPAADFGALVRSKHLAGLTHLTVRRTDAGDAGVEAIVRAGLLARLVELDLSFGCVTDAGARLLAAAPDYGHLESLSLAGNRLTPAGVAASKRKGLALTADSQQRPNEHGEFGDGYLYHDADPETDDLDDFDDLDDWE